MKKTIISLISLMMLPIVLAVPSISSSAIQTFDISNGTDFEEYVSVSIEKLNETHWNVTAKINDEFKSAIKDCYVNLTDNDPQTHCNLNQFTKKWLGKKNKDVDFLELVQLLDYPILNQTNDIKIHKNNPISYYDGNFSFLLSFPNGFKDGEELKIGLNSIFITSHTLDYTIGNGKGEIFRGLNNNVYMLRANSSGGNSDIMLFNSTDNTTFTFMTDLDGGDAVTTRSIHSFQCEGQIVFVHYVISNNGGITYRFYNYSNATLSGAVTITMQGAGINVDAGELSGNSCSTVWLSWRNTTEGVMHLVNITNYSTVGADTRLNMSSFPSNAVNTHAVDSSGTVHIISRNITSVGGDRQSIMYANYSPITSSYSIPKVIVGGANTTLANFSLDSRSLVMFNDTMYIFVYNYSSDGVSNSVFFTKSSDKGVTFSAPVNITNSSGTWKANAVFNRTNNLIVLLTNSVSNTTSYMTSNDLGGTWSNQTQISSGSNLQYSASGSTYLTTNNFSTIVKTIDLAVENSSGTTYSYYYDSVTIYNSVPTISAANATTNTTGRLSNSANPTNNNTFVNFTVSFTDADGNFVSLLVCSTNVFISSNRTCNGTTWARSVGTTLLSPLSASYTLTSSETNDTYEWFAFIWDGTDVSSSVGGNFSVNHPPNISSISLSTIVPTANDVIECRVSYSDPDNGDTASFNYTWWRNGAVNANNAAGNTTPANMSANTNDNITCSSYATDNSGQFSTSINSTSAVVRAPSSGSGGGGGGVAGQTIIINLTKLGVCGNNQCEFGENASSCATDCGNISFYVEPEFFFQSAERGKIRYDDFQILNPNPYEVNFTIYLEKTLLEGNISEIDPSSNWAFMQIDNRLFTKVQVTAPPGNQRVGGIVRLTLRVQPPFDVQEKTYRFLIVVTDQRGGQRVINYRLKVGEDIISKTTDWLFSPILPNNLLSPLTLPALFIIYIPSTYVIAKSRKFRWGKR